MVSAAGIRNQEGLTPCIETISPVSDKLEPHYHLFQRGCDDRTVKLSSQASKDTHALTFLDDNGVTFAFGAVGLCAPGWVQHLRDKSHCRNAIAFDKSLCRPLEWIWTRA